jgi:hypothetical protein
MAKELTSATVQQLANPPTAFPVNGETAGWLGFFVSALVGVILHLRRKTSRDGVEILKDRTEGALLKTALEERDNAMRMANEAWAKANSDAGTIGQLKAENEYLKRELVDARAQISAVRRGVQEVGKQVDVTENNLSKVERRVGATGPAPLGDQ